MAIVALVLGWDTFQQELGSVVWNLKTTRGTTGTSIEWLKQDRLRSMYPHSPPNVYGNPLPYSLFVVADSFYQNSKLTKHRGCPLGCPTISLGREKG